MTVCSLVLTSDVSRQTDRHMEVNAKLNGHYARMGIFFQAFCKFQQAHRIT